MATLLSDNLTRSGMAARVHVIPGINHSNDPDGVRPADTLGSEAGRLLVPSARSRVAPRHGYGPGLPWPPRSVPPWRKRRLLPTGRREFASMASVSLISSGSSKSFHSSSEFWLAGPSLCSGFHGSSVAFVNVR